MGYRIASGIIGGFVAAFGLSTTKGLISTGSRMVFGYDGPPGHVRSAYNELEAMRHDSSETVNSRRDLTEFGSGWMGPKILKQVAWMEQRGARAIKVLDSAGRGTAAWLGGTAQERSAIVIRRNLTQEAKAFDLGARLKGQWQIDSPDILLSAAASDTRMLAASMNELSMSRSKLVKGLDVDSLKGLPGAAYTGGHSVVTPVGALPVFDKEALKAAAKKMGKNYPDVAAEVQRTYDRGIRQPTRERFQVAPAEISKRGSVVSGLLPSGDLMGAQTQMKRNFDSRRIRASIREMAAGARKITGHKPTSPVFEAYGRRIQHNKVQGRGTWGHLFPGAM